MKLVGGKFHLLPWVSQALTIGMISLNLWHCLLSSSLSLPWTSNSLSEVGRSSNVGSDRMPGHFLINNLCSELGRQSFGSDRISGQRSITNSCSELGKLSAGSILMALHPSIRNFLRLGSVCSRAGRYCRLLQCIKLISLSELTNRMDSCSSVKRSTQ